MGTSRMLTSAYRFSGLDPHGNGMNTSTTRGSTLTPWCAWSLLLLAAGSAANAQFKIIGPAPYSEALAHQKIKALLENIDPSNRPQTVETLTGLLVWYRDILDDELIAAWQKDTRA